MVLETKKTNCVVNGRSICETRRVVKSVQPRRSRFPQPASNQDYFGSKRAFIEKRFRCNKECPLQENYSNKQYAMDGAASSSQRVNTLKHNILNHKPPNCCDT